MILLPLFASLGLFSAPDQGVYQMEPWEAIRPFWSDPIADSVRPGRPIIMCATQHSATGTLTGLDTFELSATQGVFRSRSTYWTFQADTTRVIHEQWRASRLGRLDSSSNETWRHDSSVHWTHFSSQPVPGGVLSLMDYGPTRTSRARIDSFYTWFDESGRKTSTRTVRPAILSPDTSRTPHYVGLGSLETDSIEWGLDGAPRVWRTFDSSRTLSNAPFRVTRSEHWLAWDGQNLVHDSAWTSTRDGSGLPTISTSVTTCSWEGTRLQGCSSPLGGAMVTWDRSGRPLSRFGRISTLWSWDSLGRMTRLREWGTETDLDSLDYGAGPWPIRRRSYTCTNESPLAWDSIAKTTTLSKDSCELREVTDYTYTFESATGVAPQRRPRVDVQRTGNALTWDGLDPRTHLVRLADLAGRTIVTTYAHDGTGRLIAPTTGGLAVWIAEDTRGTPLATGRIALP